MERMQSHARPNAERGSGIRRPRHAPLAPPTLPQRQERLLSYAAFSAGFDFAAEAHDASGNATPVGKTPGGMSIERM
jgi:hypothetical protein